ncbi:fumarate reductase [Acidovorax sp. Leaf76]|uniref:NAD(P)-binding protein n=1 Tax=unclassified Acidovorax TaxID=2684926 RepID=UPI0006FD48E8|nr:MULTISPECIES: NAD(P)-binding protein [unclassified Acidovorax]KQO26729.1 fumarate reductase [Acidovorax sp. Leaf76]KQO40499.1 fumarate reductase [Acidovorax sp. Leaf84]KQS42641.1 fumarate reductase [Acidovorax sp. Leaf191]
MQRRHFLATGALATSAVLLPGCDEAPRTLQGGFAGIDMQRGHALRDLLKTGTLPEPTVLRRAQVIIAGGGVAGLAAARSLRLAGVDDFALLELEDSAGGNSRGGAVGGIACPLGAHYLPVPGDDAPEVQNLLEELGLRQRVSGRWRYDERHLCHSPQERLFFQGEWQEGLLPVHGVPDTTIAQYRRFAQAVDDATRAARFTMPMMRSLGPGQPLPQPHQALDAVTFATWLDQQGFDDGHLRWYLDYSCRDDYGAGTAVVSAWAGIHYFASRHGFHAPGEAADESRESVLTWPEGNGWITRRLAAPLQNNAQGGGQLRTATSVLRITEGRHGVEVDAYNHATDSVERWQAPRCIVALPVHIASRVVRNPPTFLTGAAQRLTWAPWLVANLHIDSPLTDRPGAAPAWDNVLYADATPGGLGYVDAGHQRLDTRATLAGPTVLTYYQALGSVPDGRQQLAQQPWQHWAEGALAALSVPHPDLRRRVTRVEVTRYGHAMAIPTPGLVTYLSQIGLYRAPGKRSQLSKAERALALPTPATARLAFAHSDWSGYSVFEEAFTRGHGAGLVAAAG